MKQKFLVSVILPCLMLLATTAFGQRARVSPEQARGMFKASAQMPEPINVQYLLQPAAPDNLVLQIIPGAEFRLDAHITNAKGQEVLQIPSETVSVRYASSLDISKLAPGQYFIEVKTGANAGEVYRMPFSVGAK